MSPASMRAFVRANAAIARAELVPEIALHLATEVTPLWHATEAWLAAREVAPPFWAFAWAGGQALARYVIDRPETVRGKRVVDLASGAGVVAIAAAMAGASEIVAVDVDPIAAAACALNAEANGVAIDARGGDALATDLTGFDVVVAGDVFYERAMAERFVELLAAAARDGRIALAGDPERTYAPTGGVRVVATYDVPTPIDLEGRASRRTHVLAFE